MVGLGLACSASRAPAADSAVKPQTCSGGATCLGDAVHACQGGVLGGLLDDCAAQGKVCSLARCTSSDCQLAEGNTDSLVGCLFYSLQADNVASDTTATTSFLVTNPGDDPAAVEIEQPGVGAASGRTAWIAASSLEVATGQSGRLRAANLAVTGVGTNPQSALRISSDRPVTVVEIESDDADQNATSTGGTMILPLQSLGVEYRAVTYPQVSTQAVAGTPGGRDGAARVMIVGTQMGTTVHLRPFGQVTTDLDDGTQAIAPGQDYPIALDDGDVFQIYSGAEGEDLTGCHVTSDQSVAVFSGNISTTYGSQARGVNSPDMAHEQMPPLVTWSRTYVAAPLTPQASVACTSFFGMSGASIWRVLASATDTEITFDVPSTTTLQLLPPSPATPEPLVQPLVLGAGEAQSLIAVGSFTATATSPILMTQGMDCEPSLSLAIAADSGALLKDLRFAVLPNFDQLLAVVRPRNTAVELDGVAIPDGMFQSAGVQFDVGEVPLSACPPAADICTHHLTAAGGFGMTLRGMDVESSYALTAPALVGCDPAFEVCLN